jgi:hypothetical protein
MSDVPRKQLDDRTGLQRELSLDRIARNQGALCIECRACGRRSALTVDNCPHIRLGNKTLVKSLKCKYQLHGCGQSSPLQGPYDG